jgi:hypothetical protein
MQDAKMWLERAFDLDESKKLRLMALEDCDLEPLRKNIGEWSEP